MTTALIAEDEPVLASEIREELGRLWPELDVCAVVHDGAKALHQIGAAHPDVLFLDVQMPELNGIEVARIAGSASHVVFITAYEHYAVQAFEQGAVDYLLKPLDTARLARAVHRIKERLGRAPRDLTALLEQLLRHGEGERLRWITVLKGSEIQFIAVDDVCYFKADNGYVAVVTADGESLITTPLRELTPRLDASVFMQIRRGVLVNIREVQSARRTIGGHLELQLKSRPERLRVSAGHAAQFRHM